MEIFAREDRALVWRSTGQTVRTEPWGKNSLRVRATLNAGIREDWPGALLKPVSTRPKTEIGEDKSVIGNGALTAEISASGKIRFLDSATGEEILSEKHPRIHETPRTFKSVSGDLFRIESSFASYEGERIYGLGQHQHGRLDQKGCVIDLIQQNTEVNIPFLISSRGYGFLWNNPAVGRVELGANGTRWVAEAAPQLDYWVTAGKTPAEILEHYVDATGHPTKMPKWATGFWQCKLRYRSQKELLSVAREHKRRGLPLSVIVIDFFHWTMQGDWQFDPKKWPDPSAMVRELEEMGVKVMVSIWMTVNALSPNFAEMRQRGLLIRTERGLGTHHVFVDSRPEGPVYLHDYDATNPQARQYLWEKVREGYYKHGIKSWWLDVCEPEMVPMHADNLRYYVGNGAAVTNIYPMMHAQAFYEGMLSEGEEEVVSLCRSGWAGIQRYGATIWSGDVPSTFESLQKQISAGLNMALSGIPYWTTDIGGFYGGNPESPDFRELVVRWFQFGAFCPIFRLHGVREPLTSWTDSGGPNEVWSFGKEAYAIIRELLFMRERLRTYIDKQMDLAHEKGVPPMRPLFYDFPKDSECWKVEDQFMFGPDLLIAPILHQGARTRDLYLPAGTDWTDAWTGEKLKGGQNISTDAPIERIPVYLRGKAKLPIRE